MTQQAATMNGITSASAVAEIGIVDGWQRLEYLDREQRRLEACLALWTAKKERTEAQIAAVNLEKKLLLSALLSAKASKTS